MPTIADVAKRAGVSTYTVSAVLNRSARVSPELTRRVHQAVAELDYRINFIARSLQTRRTNAVGLLIPDIANPFYSTVVAGAEQVCRAKGYCLLLTNTREKLENQSACIDRLRARQIDGIALFMTAGSEDALRPIIENKTPILFLGRQPASLPGDCVKVDNFTGIQLATQHLLSRGHQRIALLNGPHSLSVSAERTQAWRQTLHAANLPAPEHYLLETDWSADSAFQATLQLCQLPAPPTAILTSNFPITTGALRALKSLHIPPSQIELFSSDDVDWLDAFSPSISAIVQPGFEMGRTALELLIHRIENPSAEFQTIALTPSLNIRH